MDATMASPSPKPSLGGPVAEPLERLEDTPGVGRADDRPGVGRDQLAAARH
jgi:hypothetical protein